MSQAINCWDFMQCGYAPNGESSEQLPCPAVQATQYHGVNEGINGGRFCWVIDGTRCNGTVQGGFTEKFLDCMACPFYAHLAQQYNNQFTINPDQLD